MPISSYPLIKLSGSSGYYKVNQTQTLAYILTDVITRTVGIFSVCTVLALEWYDYHDVHKIMWQLEPGRAFSLLLGCSHWARWPDADGYKMNWHVFIFKCTTLAICQDLQVSQPDRAAFTMAGERKSWTGFFFNRHAYLGSARNNSSVWSFPPPQYTHSLAVQYMQIFSVSRVVKRGGFPKGSRLQVRSTCGFLNVYATDVMINFFN